MNSGLLKYLYLLFFLSFAIPSIVGGQSNFKIRFTTINTDDGLSNNSVNAIAKDHLGFIWIGTTDGLCRYESSNHVKIYRAGFPNIKGGLESSNVRSLFLDSKNNLWIGTRLGGLTKFHQPSGTWKTYRHRKNDRSSISNDEILTIAEDHEGRIWVGTEDGLNVYNEEKDSFLSFRSDFNNPDALQGKAILDILIDANGWIWVGTWAGGLHLLITRDGDNLADATFRSFLPSKKEEAANIWKIIQDRENRYWVGSRGAGLFLMDLPEGANNSDAKADWEPSYHNYSFDNDRIGLADDHLQDIFEDSKSNIWIATVNGLNLISAENLAEEEAKRGDREVKPALVFHNYAYSSTDDISLTNNDVSSIFEDDQGIIWFGTYGGLSQYNWYTNQFDVHELLGVVSQVPNTQNLYIDKNGIAWLGNGMSGLIKYNFETEKAVHVNLGVEYKDKEFISALYSLDDRYLYIGSSAGVAILDMETNALKRMPYQKWMNVAPNIPFVRCLMRDKHGHVWIGTGVGLFVVSEEEGEYAAIKHDPNDPNSLSDNSINTVLEDSRGGLWVGTYNGLNKVKGVKGSKILFERFKHKSEDPENSVSSNRVVAIEEVNGKLFIGSDSGLCSYDLNEKKFTNYSKNDNKHCIQSLQKSNDGNIWGSTTEGIFFLNIENKVFENYKKKDGLGDLIFQIGSSYLDKDGYFNFGSRGGITRFNPTQIKRNEIPPAVYVTDIRKMSPDKELIVNGINEEELVVEHNEYYLSLNYVALNYNRPEKNKYAFMLEGLEENWNYSNNKTKAVYTNLSPGEYYFHVKAANNDGIWNEKGTTLKIIKKPAFWETMWFKVVGLLLLIGGIYISFILYTKSIKNRNIILQKYNDTLNEEIKQRELVEQELQERERKLKSSNDDLQRSNKDLEEFAYIASHDLQEPLRVVGSFIGLLGRRYKDHFDEQAFEYIDYAVDGVKRMSQQINSILTFSKVGSSNIIFEPTALNHVVKMKLHDLSQNIKEKNVTVNVQDLPEINCAKDQIEMVFHNLISNAIKFNKKENPIVSISHDAIDSDEFWQFSVSDNGIGIQEEYKDKVFEIFRRLQNKRDYEGTGIGLALCQRIVYRHQGKIWLESEIGKGTTFFFTISKRLKNEEVSKNQKGMGSFESV